MISTDRLTDVFVEVADSLAHDFDVVDFLHSLAGHVAAVSGADAVGVLLADQWGELRCVAASNESARMLGLLELEDSDGPCLDCYADRAPVAHADLADASDRWPTFAPAVVAAGFHSVHAFPLRLRGTVIGTLGLYGHLAVGFAAQEARIVQAIADVATIALLQERAITRSEVLTEELERALASRIVIEQAKGALARLEGSTPSEAFELLRSEARRSHRPLVDVAAEVIAGISTFIQPGGSPP